MGNIDECANCGGIRVAKSTLCADCLAALVADLGEKKIRSLRGLERNLKNMAEIIRKKDAEIEKLNSELEAYRTLRTWVERYADVREKEELK